MSGVVAVDPHEPEVLHHLPERADVEQRACAPQADIGLIALRRLGWVEPMRTMRTRFGGTSARLRLESRGEARTSCGRLTLYKRQVPTLLVVEGFRFWFYTNEGREAPHVHVSKAGAAAKVWLQPVHFAYSYGFTPSQLKRIRELVFEHQASFVERWHEHFGR